MKTDLRISMPEQTHAYHHTLHTRLREAEERPEEQEPAITQVQILEESAAMGEGALNLESKAPFRSAGLAMQEALIRIETS